MRGRQLFALTLILTTALMAGCSLQRRGITEPTAVCSGAPGPVGFLGWTTANLPPGSVTLTWDQASGVVTTYVIELSTTRGTTSVGTVIVGGSARAHTIDGLAAGDYFARVRARNACGTSAPSNEANPRVR
jgi:hypothetical protein